MDAVPATDEDRRGAFEELKELLSSGRIDAAEFATRSSKISNAATLTELAALVTDHGRAPARSPSAKQGLGSVVTDAIASPAFGRSLGRFAMVFSMRRVIIWVVGLVLAGGAAVATSFFDDVGTGTGPTSPSITAGPTQGTSAAPSRPRLLTSAGLVKLRNDLRAKTGSTRYLSAVIYPDYATVEVPIAGDASRSRRWYYNGSFPYNPIDTPRRPGATSSDLRDVRISALARAIRRAPAQLNVRRADRRHLIFDSRSGRNVMSVYVTDPANRTGYWTMKLSGTTVVKYRAP
ncbi:DUF1707 domain-containing protein [Aeromicrobium sp. NPDC092404]|uniref:DUF1707 SHOCT-like domain-containing protein n=1 Tax=Aeromicrobium sp. NPDC092404 TaxID=3154976 RepID=UPI0034358673